MIDLKGEICHIVVKFNLLANVPDAMPLFHTVKGFLNACNSGEEASARKYIEWQGRQWAAQAFDGEHQTAMHLCARTGLIRLIPDLLRGGANVNARNDAGRTPLTYAAEYGQNDVVHLLLEKGADPNMADKYGKLPIDYAAGNGRDIIVKLLIDGDAVPDTRNQPLITALSCGYAGAAAELLAGGAAADIHSADYRTPLHLAASQNALDVMKTLLEKGAVVNARTTAGATPLHFAVENNSVMAIEFLLAHGASPLIENTDGKTPLMRAKERSYDQCVRVLEATAKPKDTPAPTVPVVAPAAAASDAPAPEEWVKLAPGKIAHVGEYPAIGRKITEIYNLASRERVIITENLKTGAETTTQPEKFENIPEETVKQATEAAARLGSAPDAPKRSFNL
jgi:ankyrin repeat protein